MTSKVITSCTQSTCSAVSPWVPCHTRLLSSPPHMRSHLPVPPSPLTPLLECCSPRLRAYLVSILDERNIILPHGIPQWRSTIVTVVTMLIKMFTLCLITHKDLFIFIFSLWFVPFCSGGILRNYQGRGHSPFYKWMGDQVRTWTQVSSEALHTT